MKKVSKYLLVVAGVIGFIFGIWWFGFRESGLMQTRVLSSAGAQYQLSLPGVMSPAPQLNDNASLQYADADAELYVVIIDDSKGKITSFGLDYDLDTYMKIASRNIDSVGVFVNTKKEINNLPALQATIVRKQGGNESTYWLTCVESEKFFYQILLWTPTARLESNRETMESIIASFSE